MGNSPHWFRLTMPKPRWYDLFGWVRWYQRKAWLRRVSAIMDKFHEPLDEDWFNDFIVYGTTITYYDDTTGKPKHVPHGNMYAEK